MANPTRIEVNCTTGEVMEIELTDEEVAEREAAAVAAQAEADQLAAEAKAKEVARAALFDKLGITADEAKLLLS